MNNLDFACRQLAVAKTTSGMRNNIQRQTDQKRVWSGERWRSYFHRQRETLIAIPWHLGSEFTTEEIELICPSVQQFQQGEGLEGGHFFRCVKSYGERTGDWDYVEAHRLFMAEENRHARDLARYMELADMPLLDRQSKWNKAFRWLGSRGGLETTLAIILMVEVIAQTYYSALRTATKSTVLRRLCEQILRDEKSHVRFQAERIAILRRRRPRWRILLSHGFDLVLFAGAGLSCWIGHRRLLRVGGFGLFRYWRQAWRMLRSAWKLKNPMNYR